MRDSTIANPAVARFPRAARLTRPSEFRRVFQRPVVVADDTFKIFARANALDRSRLGLAVSRRACPRASGRNRIKRVVRECFRHQDDLATARPALDLVVMARPAAAAADNERLRTALSALWPRLLRRLGQQDTDGVNE